MSVVPRRMARVMHRHRPPHNGGQQRPAISCGCLCVVGVPADSPRHRPIPIGQKPAFQCAAPATGRLSEEHMAMRDQKRHGGDYSSLGAQILLMLVERRAIRKLTLAAFCQIESGDPEAILAPIKFRGPSSGLVWQAGPYSIE